jgi:hypothetical protein
VVFGDWEFNHVDAPWSGDVCSRRLETIPMRRLRYGVVANSHE